jgi:diguanylate cyclase (GGDEF)-like protein/PAS domain S-box-containing protein
VAAFDGAAGFAPAEGSVPLRDLVRVFLELMARHPEAIVAALNDEGIVTDLPAAVPLLQHRVAAARSVLDMLTPGDKLAMISAWDRSRREGGASVVVRLVSDPDEPVLVTMVNACDEFGVYLALVFPVDDAATAALTPGASAGIVTPRTARVRKNELAIICEIDEATTAILGWRPDEIVGRRSLEFVHPDDHERAISNWMEMLTAPGHDQRVRLRHRMASGGWLWVEITNRNLLAEPDSRIVTEMVDISDEMAAQDALAASEQRLRLLAESLPVGVLQIEADRRISYANERLTVITGVPLSRAVDRQFRHLGPSDRERFHQALGAVLDGHDQELHVAFQNSTGDVHCTVSMRSLTDAGQQVTGAIVCVTDVTDQVRLTAELERRATYDSLTGCLNRPSVMSWLEALLVGPNDGVAIVFVDLDGFKEFNDDLGHAAGDALLAGIGRLLRQAARDGDKVGRVGGDEFLVVGRDVADIDEALALAARIDAVLEDGVDVGGTRVVVRASLGVAQTSDPSTSSDRLVADADTRMYIEKRGRKQRGGAGLTRPPSLRTRASDDTVALRRAVQQGELEPHYQPIVSLTDGDVFGLEALVRWRRHGEVIPAIAFIGLAERSGLIHDMGVRLRADVAHDAAVVAADGGTDVRWFVNMSPLELAAPNAVGQLYEVLQQYQVDPAHVVVEVTEHSDLTESSAARRALGELASHGIEIALDDFGTGYSSFALLRSAPVSYLKFDKSFTADLGRDRMADALLATCLDLTHRLDIRLVVEGVETEAQRDALLGWGVELAQGYLFAPPRPLDAVRAELRPRR